MAISPIVATNTQLKEYEHMVILKFYFEEPISIFEKTSPPIKDLPVSMLLMPMESLKKLSKQLLKYIGKREEHTYSVVCGNCKHYQQKSCPMKAKRMDPEEDSCSRFALYEETEATLYCNKQKEPNDKQKEPNDKLKESKHMRECAKIIMKVVPKTLSAFPEIEKILKRSHEIWIRVRAEDTNAKIVKVKSGQKSSEMELLKDSDKFLGTVVASINKILIRFPDVEKAIEERGVEIWISIDSEKTKLQVVGPGAGEIYLKIQEMKAMLKADKFDC